LGGNASVGLQIGTGVKGALMAKLIYSAIASADGYVEDAAGNFDWAAPDEELHCFVNDLERPVGTYLYPLRAPDVRDDALLGNCPHDARPAAFRP
jgi:hypothetical protein